MTHDGSSADAAREARGAARGLKRNSAQMQRANASVPSMPHLVEEVPSGLASSGVGHYNEVDDFAFIRFFPGEQAD
jgi:hypothetical protein